jgi:phage gpG-like protein
MIKLTGKWDFVTRNLFIAAAALPKAIDTAVMQEAQAFRKEIVQGITKQAPGGVPFRPLHPRTLALRRARGFKGTKILIVTGDLRNSITAVRVSRGVFVGILRSTRHRGGDLMVNVAAIHEFGSADGRIPARPYMEPVYQKFIQGVSGRLVKRVAQNVFRVFI